MSCNSFLPMLNGSFDPGFLLDNEGNVIQANAAAERVFNLGQDDRTTHTNNVSDIFSFRGENAWEKIVGDLAPASSLQCEGTGFKRNGSAFPITINLIKLGFCTCNGQTHQGDAGVTYICAYLRELDPVPDKRIAELEEQVTRLNRTQAALIKASEDSMIIVDLVGTIKSVDKVTLDQFGYTESELVGRSIRVLMKDEPEEDNDSKYIEKYLEESRELEAKRKDGTTFPMELGVAEIESDEGDKRLFVGAIHNMNRSKQALKMLERSERIRHGFLDASFHPMFHISETGIILMTNKAAVEAFGWEMEEFTGKSISMISGEGHDHDWYLDIGEKRYTGKGRELQARRKDGSEFPIELGLTEVKAVIGEEHLFCAFVRDLTRQRDYELKLQKKQRFTTGIIETSFDAMFSIDENGIIRMVNQKAVDEFGWGREEFLGQNIKMITGGGHSEHHDNYIKRYLETGEKRVMGQKRELIGRRKDGSEFPIELGLAEVETDSGEKRLFCGFVRNLTRQKQDEVELKRKHRFTMGIIEASFDALFSINELGIIQMANEMAVKQFGWSREEFIGQNIKMICGGGHCPHHDSYLKRYLETGEKRVMGKKRELTARRKDGSEFPIELGLTEIKTETGEERLFVGFVKEITRQKKEEMELKQNLKLVSLLMRSQR